jgi:hypothetical protein
MSSSTEVLRKVLCRMSQSLGPLLIRVWRYGLRSHLLHYLPTELQSCMLQGAAGSHGFRIGISTIGRLNRFPLIQWFVRPSSTPSAREVLYRRVQYVEYCTENSTSTRHEYEVQYFRTGQDRTDISQISTSTKAPRLAVLCQV